QRGVHGCVALNAHWHGQGACVELQRQQAGLVERQAGDDTRRGQDSLYGRRRDLLTIEEDAELLSGQALSDLPKDLRPVAVELERDIWQARAAGEGHLLVARHQVCAGQGDRLTVELAGGWDPLAAGVLLLEFEFGRLTNQL